MKCKVCEHPSTIDQWCQRHGEAAKNLVAQYPAWVRGFGQLSWTDYLKQVIANENTGPWVLDVAKTNPPHQSITK